MSSAAAPSQGDNIATPKLRESSEGSIIETLQSLIVAFVLAMTFRGFVIEGFVIPTGSMAPTLLGQHLLVHSGQTGSTFAVGLDPLRGSDSNRDTRGLKDAMLGEHYLGSASPAAPLRHRTGDRILVLKSLYPFFEPTRFDVVVFKNPTDPVGDTSNYIKRLVGLPNEHIWLADGDVFAAPLDEGESPKDQSPNGQNERSERDLDFGRFKIQRKPEHVQRAVWQTVHHSDYAPRDINQLNEQTRRSGGERYLGPPWVGDPQQWDLTGRAYTCSTIEPTTLQWDNSRRAIDDWTAYNMLTSQREEDLTSVSDIRVSAGIVAQQPGFATTLEIEARSWLFQFTIAQGQASMRMESLDDSSVAIESQPVAVDLPEPGGVFNVEFWHVDQSMRFFVDGNEVVEPLLYDWSPLERLQHATSSPGATNVDHMLHLRVDPPELRWRFAGSPVTLHRVRVDRDLYYRPGTLGPRQLIGPQMQGYAFGTHPSKNAAILGPNQFMMCGDNSQASLDSRLWGRPHALVAMQIDDAPFVVHRKLLLGKAWVVYFPAMHTIGPGGNNAVVPDFGRLRFIR